MRRTPAVALALTLGLVLIPAAAILGAHSQPVRVFARASRVVVDSSSGAWSNRYTLTVGPSLIDQSTGNVSRDSTVVRVSRSTHDRTRVGTHLTLRRARFFSSVSWLADSASRWHTLTQAIAARTTPTRQPSAVSPLDAQTAGLARVIAVHSVRMKPSARTKNGETSAPQWIHLVELEFWARSTRTLVRTIDVIDAASIPGLRNGTILQMHYDARDPEIVRLDDGMRTFTSGTPN